MLSPSRRPARRRRPPACRRCRPSTMPSCPAGSRCACGPSPTTSSSTRPARPSPARSAQASRKSTLAGAAAREHRLANTTSTTSAARSSTPSPSSRASPAGRPQPRSTRSPSTSAVSTRRSAGWVTRTSRSSTTRAASVAASSPRPTTRRLRPTCSPSSRTWPAWPAARPGSRSARETYDDQSITIFEGNLATAARRSRRAASAPAEKVSIAVAQTKDLVIVGVGRRVREGRPGHQAGQLARRPGRLPAGDRPGRLELRQPGLRRPDARSAPPSNRWPPGRPT